MKVAAVVVTYNRLALLKGCLDSIRNQTRKVEEIIVVNNSSTDQTPEWLATQRDLTVITQANLGGAAGFHTGLKAAYERGYDWIWIMDDDVFPDPEALGNLLKQEKELRPDDDVPPAVMVPVRLYEDGSLANLPAAEWDVASFSFLNDTMNLGRKSLNNTYRSVSELPQYLDVLDLTFEGPLIPRQAVERVGLPSKEYFIYGDDTDYSFRLKRAGFRIVLVSSSRIVRKIFPSSTVMTTPWRTRLYVRNTLWLSRLYGENWFARRVRPWVWSFRYFGPGIAKGTLLRGKGMLGAAFRGLREGLFYPAPRN